MFSTKQTPSPRVVTIEDGPSAGSVVHKIDGKAVWILSSAGDLVRQPIQGGAASLGLLPDPANPSLVKVV